MRRELRFVVFWSECAWVASLVDHDLVTQGRTLAEARASLEESLRLTAIWDVHDGNPPTHSLEREAASAQGVLERAKHFAEMRYYWGIAIPFDERNACIAGAIHKGVIVFDAEAAATSGRLKEIG